MSARTSTLMDFQIRREHNLLLARVEGVEHATKALEAQTAIKDLSERLAVLENTLRSHSEACELDKKHQREQHQQLLSRMGAIENAQLESDRARLEAQITEGQLYRQALADFQGKIEDMTTELRGKSDDIRQIKEHLNSAQDRVHQHPVISLPREPPPVPDSTDATLEQSSSARRRQNVIEAHTSAHRDRRGTRPAADMMRTDDGNETALSRSGLTERSFYNTTSGLAVKRRHDMIGSNSMLGVRSTKRRTERQDDSSQFRTSQLRTSPLPNRSLLTSTPKPAAAPTKRKERKEDSPPAQRPMPLRDAKGKFIKNGGRKRKTKAQRKPVVEPEEEEDQQDDESDEIRPTRVVDENDSPWLAALLAGRKNYL